MYDMFHQILYNCFIKIRKVNFINVLENRIRKKLFNKEQSDDL